MNTQQTIAEAPDSGRVKVTPWVRGIGNRDTIYYLWRLMEDAGATQYVFYAQERDPNEEHLRGDLVDFVRYFEPTIGDPKQILVAQDQSNDEIMGYSWFDRIKLGVRANCSVFYRRKFWGSMGREASRMTLEWGFDKEKGLGVEEIIGYAPWKWSLNHCLWLGMKVIDIIPSTCILDNKPTRLEFKGKPLDVTVLRISKDEFYAK